VVMDPQGRAGVDVTAALSVRAPFLRRLAVGLLVAGAVVAPVGGLLLAAGVRRLLHSRPPRVEPE
jgi:Tfp pilus assembly protein FimV